jgi:5-methylcytosine-specific restriction protein A
VNFALESVKLRAGRESVISTLRAPDHQMRRGIRMAPEESKRCTKCGEAKPFSDYARAKLGLYGLKAVCRVCAAAYEYQRNAPLREAVARRRAERALAQEKQCRKCHETKPLSAFTPNSRASLGVNNWCKSCYGAYSKEYYQATHSVRLDQQRALRRKNADAINARVRAQKAADPEKFREYFRKNYQAKRDRVRVLGKVFREANKQRLANKSKEYQRRNLHIFAANGARRKARKMNAPGRGVTSQQWKAVLDASLGLCAYCNEKRPLTLDHIEPLASGGAHDIDNITAACRRCNCSKRDTLLLVWLAHRAQYLAFPQEAAA